MLALALPACAPYQRNEQLAADFRAGDFAGARKAAYLSGTQDPSDRSYMLDQVKYTLAALAEGVPGAAEQRVHRIYDQLRTQGLNADRTTSSFIVGEANARIWKGEPFEQAMLFCYVSYFDGLDGQWGNVRASADNSLFLLKDFSKALAQQRATRADPLEQRQAIIRQAQLNDRNDSAPDTLPLVYTPAQSDFELGYALKAIAARQLNLSAEVQEATGQLRELDPARLSMLAQNIASADYNTVLVVDYGLGPQKFGAGPDRAIAMFRPTTRSGDQPLIVTSAGGASGQFPVVTDLNRLAQDVKWTNLEDLRLAKSAIGDVLLVGGGVTAVASRNRTAQAAGAGAAVLGALLKSTAAADTRHVEVMPQRTYIALLKLTGPTDLTLEIAGLPGTRLVLPQVPAPSGPQAQLRYIRLPDNAGNWARSGQVLYSSDAVPLTPPSLPYILGGRDVRTPSWEVLREYQAAGLPSSLSLSDLQELYRLEGITIAGAGSEDDYRGHVLEGGSSLYSPLAGSTGFVRLLCREHPPYQPKSAQVRQLMQSIRANPSNGPSAK